MVTAPAQPAPLPRPALDSHTHLDMIDLPISAVVAAARAAGIVRIVTVGTDLESSRWSARCADDHDGVYAAVAIHPNETQAVSAEVGTGAPVPGSPAGARSDPTRRASLTGPCRTRFADTFRTLFEDFTGITPA